MLAFLLAAIVILFMIPFIHSHNTIPCKHIQRQKVASKDIQIIYNFKPNKKFHKSYSYKYSFSVPIICRIISMRVCVIQQNNVLSGSWTDNFI